MSILGVLGIIGAIIAILVLVTFFVIGRAIGNVVHAVKTIAATTGSPPVSTAAAVKTATKTVVKAVVAKATGSATTGAALGAPLYTQLGQQLVFSVNATIPAGASSVSMVSSGGTDVVLGPTNGFNQRFVSNGKGQYYGVSLVGPAGHPPTGIMSALVAKPGPYTYFVGTNSELGLKLPGRILYVNSVGKLTPILKHAVTVSTTPITPPIPLPTTPLKLSNGQQLVFNLGPNNITLAPVGTSVALVDANGKKYITDGKGGYYGFGMNLTHLLLGVEDSGDYKFYVNSSDQLCFDVGTTCNTAIIKAGSNSISFTTAPLPPSIPGYNYFTVTNT